MKKIFLIIIIFLITFNFQSLTRANDIRDFQVEGISIGDSLLDYFNKKDIEQKAEAMYPNKEMKAATFKSYKFDKFEEIQFHWISKDNKYKIQSISANIDYKNNINGCLELRKKINSDIRSLFDEPKEEDWGKRVLDNVDPSLQTFAYQNIYWLQGGNIIISCRDYGKNKEKDLFTDYLSILIDSKLFADWINNKAWN